jgi:myo-inositol-1(or 4)-monophosphatase
MAPSPASEADWLAFCRRAAAGAREAVSRHGRGAERHQYVGRGEGGDDTLAIDRAAEDAIFAELESLGLPLTAVSEERGHVAIAGGGPTHVVIDPIDGSLNAKRELPAHCLSIAVARGDSMADVVFGYVGGFAHEEEFWAQQGAGAYLDGRRLEVEPVGRLEILGVESAHPWLISAYSDALAVSEADRIRMLGSIALSLCYVAAARFDAMFSMRTCRSVDAAAGQLIVREAGGEVAFPDCGDGLGGVPLALDMRSRVAAGAGGALLEGVVANAMAVAPVPPSKA